MLELKIYQRDTLDAFSNWVEVLKEERKTSETTVDKWVVVLAMMFLMISAIIPKLRGRNCLKTVMLQ